MEKGGWRPASSDENVRGAEHGDGETPPDDSRLKEIRERGRSPPVESSVSAPFELCDVMEVRGSLINRNVPFF